MGAIHRFEDSVNYCLNIQNWLGIPIVSSRTFTQQSLFYVTWRFKKKNPTVTIWQYRKGSSEESILLPCNAPRHILGDRIQIQSPLSQIHKEFPKPSLPLAMGLGLLVGIHASSACRTPWWHLLGTYRKARFLMKQLLTSTHIRKCTRVHTHTMNRYSLGVYCNSGHQQKQDFSGAPKPLTISLANMFRLTLFHVIIFSPPLLLRAFRKAGHTRPGPPCFYFLLQKPKRKRFHF